MNKEQVIELLARRKELLGEMLKMNLGMSYDNDSTRLHVSTEIFKELVLLFNSEVTFIYRGSEEYPYEANVWIEDVQIFTLLDAKESEYDFGLKVAV